MVNYRPNLCKICSHFKDDSKCQRISNGKVIVHLINKKVSSETCNYFDELEQPIGLTAEERRIAFKTKRAEAKHAKMLAVKANKKAKKK